MLVATLLGVCGGATAQENADNRGSLRGTVLDIDSNDPLPYTRVILVPVPTGALPAGRESSFLTSSRSVLTKSDGTYRFPNIAAGSYRLHVRRIGYRPATMDLHLEGTQGLNLSVGLTVAPIRLEPLNAMSPPTDMFQTGDKSREDPGWDRADRERWRQDNFLETDVRMLSDDDVVEAITLGDTDILRALQRLPGVSTRDDWTAGLWVRGAPASQTRVYFDGLPLFNPVHAGGVTSAISSEGVGAVFLHPGVRSVEMGAGSAGVVDIKSRSAGGTGELHGRAVISTSNVGVALERRWMDGRVGTLLTGRRSWLNRSRDLVRNPDGESPDIPNDYADVIGRIDVQLDNGRTLEASAIWQRDWMEGFLNGGPAGNTSSWGTLAGRLTFQTPMAGGSFRQSLGFSRFDATVRQIEPRSPLAAFDEFPVQQPTFNAVNYYTVNGVWTRFDEDGLGPQWRLGYNLFGEDVEYRGAPTTPHSVLVYLYTADHKGSVSALNLWGERWWRPSDKLAIRAGVRVEIDNEEIGAAATSREIKTDHQFSPQISLRYNASDRLSVALAIGSNYQYEQAVAPSGNSFGPALTTSPVWILSPNTGAASRTEIGTLGVEYWLNHEWLASANYFDRATSGIAIPDPRPGSTDDDDFSVTARNRAHGIELSVRRLVGPWTGSLGYTLSSSTYSTDIASPALRFPAPSDRRHIIDATALAALSNNVAGGAIRIGGTFSAASGAPFTRIHPGLYDCTDYDTTGVCTPLVSNVVEAPNAERSPWYHAFNVLIDWSRSFMDWDIAAHVQVQNLFNTPRGVTYAVDRSQCHRHSIDSAFCGPEQDTFLSGLRRHYEIGMRLAF